MSDRFTFMLDGNDREPLFEFRDVALSRVYNE